MSTNVTNASLELAILQAVETIKTLRSVPSVEELARRAGVSKQYLYRRANHLIAAEAKQGLPNGAAPEPLRVPEAKTNDSPDGGDHSNETLPQALGRAQPARRKTNENT